MVKHLIVFSPTSVLFFLLVCVGAEISHTVREVIDCLQPWRLNFLDSLSFIDLKMPHSFILVVSLNDVTVTS